MATTCNHMCEALPEPWDHDCTSRRAHNYLREDRRGPPTVLLAEDDDDMRGFVATVMRYDGYEVIEARDGAELLDLLEEMDRRHRRPDMIVTDVLMPGISGLSVLTTLQDGDWQIPTLVITALGLDIFHDSLARVGAVVTLRKPFGVERLRTAVASARVVRDRAASNDTLPPSDAVGLAALGLGPPADGAHRTPQRRALDRLSATRELQLVQTRSISPTATTVLAPARDSLCYLRGYRVLPLPTSSVHTTIPYPGPSAGFPDRSAS